MYVTNVGNVIEHKMDKEGAHKVKVKYLLPEGMVQGDCNFGSLSSTSKATLPLRSTRMSMRFSCLEERL